MGRSEKQAVAVLALGVALILVAGVYLSLPARSPEELRKTPTSDSSDATVASAGPRLPETPTLQKAIRGCEVDREEECVERFVAEAAPGAKYVGGRVDLDANRDNRNVRVMYFEAPSLEPCEYARHGYADSDRSTSYTVLILGEGSFESERAAECVPDS